MPIYFFTIKRFQRPPPSFFFVNSLFIFQPGWILTTLSFWSTEVKRFWFFKTTNYSYKKVKNNKKIPTSWQGEFFPRRLLVLRGRACSWSSRSLGGDRELKSCWRTVEKKKKKKKKHSEIRTFERWCQVDNNNNKANADIKPSFICFLWTSTSEHGKVMKICVICIFLSLAHVSLSVTQWDSS